MSHIPKYTHFQIWKILTKILSIFLFIFFSKFTLSGESKIGKKSKIAKS